MYCSRRDRKWEILGQGRMGKGEWENRMSENEEKKEYLKGYQDSIKKVKRLEEELIELRLNKFFPSLIQDGMPHGTGSGDLSSYASKVDELERKLLKARYEKIKLMDDILYHISLLEDKDEQRVLKLRYIKGLKWKEIEEALGYSHRSVHRLHSKSLQHLVIA